MENDRGVRCAEFHVIKIRLVAVAIRRKIDKVTNSQTPVMAPNEERQERIPSPSETRAQAYRICRGGQRPDSRPSNGGLESARVNPL